MSSMIVISLLRTYDLLNPVRDRFRPAMISHLLVEILYV